MSQTTGRLARQGSFSAGWIVLWLFTAGLAAMPITGLAAPGATDGLARAPAPQSGVNLERPPHWQVRHEGSPAEERRLVVMRPGWHVFAGPAAVLWDPGSFASGNYSVSATIFLFPTGEGGSASASLDSPYGLLLAGERLEEESGNWVSFEIRNDRRFRIAHHEGGAVHAIHDWTASDAIAVWDESVESTVQNVLAVNATDETVELFINDEKVAAVARHQLPLQGVVGMTAGEGLSLHVTEIAIGAPRRDGS